MSNDNNNVEFDIDALVADAVAAVNADNGVVGDADGISLDDVAISSGSAAKGKGESGSNN